MKTPRIWKRTRLIISPAFQWSIILKTVLFTIIITTLFAWFTFYFLWKNSIANGHLSQISLLYQPELWIGWAVCLLLSVLLVGLVLLKLTHRIAGQMYRFEKALDQVIEGNSIKAVFTRKGDYFHEFQAGLNHYLNMEN
jgi:hypothetical protein